jgi:hypothetical protein
VKNLVIDNRQSSDWGMDLLFAGLVKCLGPENVIDYPFHAKHRSPPQFVGDQEKDWGAERKSMGYVPGASEVVSPSEQGIFGMLRRGEIARIFLDERPENYELYLKLKANFFSVPVVVVSGNDDFYCPSVAELRRRYGKNFRALFTENWRPAFDGQPDVHPYNLSINFDHYWNPSDRDTWLQEKEYDISFMGYGLSHPDRMRFMNHLYSKWRHLKTRTIFEDQPNTMRMYLRKRDYFEIMAKSRICLNLRGGAQNGKTLRFYEIPYVGSCMLTQDSGARQIHPLVQEEHCMYFSDEHQMDNAISFLLNNPDFREMIARNGHEFTMKYNTVETRVREMLELL